MDERQASFFLVVVFGDSWGCCVSAAGLMSISMSISMSIFRLLLSRGSIPSDLNTIQLSASIQHECVSYELAILDRPKLCKPVLNKMEPLPPLRTTFRNDNVFLEYHEH